MKKLFAVLMTLGVFSLNLFSQETPNVTPSQETDAVEAAVDSIAEVETEAEEVENIDASEIVSSEEVVERGLHQALKEKFIEGGAGFMATVAICLILGLAVAIERIIYLNLATTNTDKLLSKINTTLNEEGAEAALEICRNTPGPVASIFYQGISRMDEGIDVVEKSVVSYGSVQLGLLEKGLTWIALFIALAPMLGFLGTVVGMIEAFDAIAIAGDISPTIVAAGIKIALITTVAGLIVAMILQIFYNYLLSKIDNLTSDMEDSSISLVDIVVKYNAKK
ncbi:MAG: MotA/TolQ/ExbB proton channel family protein [Bacteroidales bacterium]|nr:MotA/TolQ/ExbB proton channel family protein [Bacteroidales bacterium]NLK80603.1 MotA/TolQ/ExbB proton channel family protein [Bacteroidales bacterium]